MDSDPRTERVCVGRHRHEPDRPRPATAGHLCGGCHDRLQRNLAEMPALHDDLLARLAKPYNGAEDDTHALAIAHKAIPLQPDVADHRDLMRRQIASWAVLVAEESNTGSPAVPRLTVVAPWLLARLAWATEQPWVNEMLAEVDQLASRARSLIAGNKRQRFVVGPCPENVVTEDDGGIVAIETCYGTLSALIRTSDDTLPSNVECDTHEAHTWTADKWMTLGRSVLRRNGLHPGGIIEWQRRMGA